MGDRVECLLEVHKAHIEWLPVLACLLHQYSEIRDLVSRPPPCQNPMNYLTKFASIIPLNCIIIFTRSLNTRAAQKQKYEIFRNG